MQSLQEGDKDERYPSLWRAMKLEDGRLLLKGRVFDFENRAGYYFLNSHTSQHFPAGGIALPCLHRAFEASSDRFGKS